MHFASPISMDLKRHVRHLMTLIRSRRLGRRAAGPRNLAGTPFVPPPPRPGKAGRSPEGRSAAEHAAVSGVGPIDLGVIRRGLMHPRISWVIVGGESGPNARPMRPDWARSVPGSRRGILFQAV